MQIFKVVASTAPQKKYPQMHHRAKTGKLLEENNLNHYNFLNQAIGYLNMIPKSHEEKNKPDTKSKTSVLQRHEDRRETYL